MQVEWKELGRLIEDDRRMREALKRECRPRMREMNIGHGSYAWVYTPIHE